MSSPCSFTRHNGARLAVRQAELLGPALVVGGRRRAAPLAPQRLPLPSPREEAVHVQPQASIAGPVRAILAAAAHRDQACPRRAADQAQAIQIHLGGRSHGSRLGLGLGLGLEGAGLEGRAQLVAREDLEQGNGPDEVATGAAQATGRRGGSR